MISFEEDWSDLLREPVRSTGVSPEEFEEDWCVLRGKDRFFVGLLADGHLIPGSIRAYTYCPTYVGGFSVFERTTATHIAFWVRDVEPFISPLDRPLEVGPWWSVFIHLDGRVAYEPPPLILTSKFYTFQLSQPVTGTPLVISSGTSSAAISWSGSTTMTLV